MPAALRSAWSASTKRFGWQGQEEQLSQAPAPTSQAHQGIDRQVPAGDKPGGDGPVHCRDVLGGIIHDDDRAAA